MRKRLLIWLLILPGLLAWPAPARSQGAEIAIVVSGAGAPYDETISGMKQYLKANQIDVSYEVLALAGEPGKADAAAQHLKTSKPALIFALGALALEKIPKAVPDVPLVAGMVLTNDDIARSGGNATGVVLSFSPDVQFQWIKKMLPGARTIGVLYNPAENQANIAKATAAAEKMGLKVEAEKIVSPRDIPDALDRLANRVEVLWGIPDDTVLNAQTSRPILLFSFRNRIPFVGPSSAWVKAGALYALDWDYADMGMQCGEMAVRILKGASAKSMPPAAPRKILYSINRKTAEEMSVKIGDEIFRQARTLF